MLDSLLDKITKEFSNWGKTCLKNILALCLAILDGETVCLYKLKKQFSRYFNNKVTQPESHYKRLTRIFVDYGNTRLWVDLLRFGFNALKNDGRYLVMDGTSWKSGKKWYHYLVLSIIDRGVAIPIYWEDLQKKGTSNFQERKRLIKKALKYYNLEGKILLADREYIGEEWFAFLKSCKIDFIIRVRNKNYKSCVDACEGKTHQEMIAKVLRSKISGKAIKKEITIGGHNFSFVAMKNPKANANEPVLFFVSSLTLPAPSIACQYQIRWTIEVCFKHMKSNGFNLEDMNVQGKAKQKLMMAVVVVAYTLSVTEGLKAYDAVKMKKYSDNKQSKAVSVFRYGLDLLINQTTSFICFCHYIIENLIDAKKHCRSPISIFVQ